MPFLTNGTNLDTIFEPIGSETKRADVGFENSGVDISNIYYPLTAGGTSPANTGFEVNGSDLANYFAGAGTVSYSSDVLIIEGDTDYSDATGIHTISPTGIYSNTTDRRCGSGSLNFLSGGCSIARVGNNLELGSGDFTIDFWLKHQIWTAPASIVLFVNYSSQGYQVLFNLTPSGQDVPYMYLGFNVIGGANYSNSFRVDNLADTTSWTHYAIVRSGNNMYGFVNGVISVWPTISGEVPAPGSNATMGTMGSMALDHFRISKEAKWTSNFSLTDAGLDYDAGTLV